MSIDNVRRRILSLRSFFCDAMPDITSPGTRETYETMIEIANTAMRHLDAKEETTVTAPNYKQSLLNLFALIESHGDDCPERLKQAMGEWRARGRVSVRDDELEWAKKSSCFQVAEAGVAVLIWDKKKNHRVEVVPGLSVRFVGDDKALRVCDVSFDNNRQCMLVHFDDGTHTSHPEKLEVWHG